MATQKRTICMLLLAFWVSVGKARPAPGETRFAVIGDYGVSSGGESPVAEMVKELSWGTQFVITAGDNNYGDLSVGSADWGDRMGDDYGSFMLKRTDSSASTYPYSTQTSLIQNFYPSVGNHDADDADENIDGYIDFFHTDPGAEGRLPVGGGTHDSMESYYDFVRGAPGEEIHFFAVDSQHFLRSDESQAAQTAWLQEGLLNSTARWKFVYLHHPPYSSANHGSKVKMQLPFQQWGVHAVFAGHDHTYERLRVTDATQTEMLYFVDGLGGRNPYDFNDPLDSSEVRYNANFGAMRVTVDSETATFEFLSIDEPGGTLQDTFVLDQQNLPTPPPFLGDMDWDGDVDVDDTPLFVIGLTDPDAYLSIYDVPPSWKGDVDADGNLDLDDVLPFVNLLTSGGAANTTAHPAPEPATWLLALAALLGMLLVSRRQRITD